MAKFLFCGSSVTEGVKIMSNKLQKADADTARLLKIALILSIITIVYNLAEGIVSVIFGYSDETIALFGFGVDSFVEVLSGIGILHMVLRMKRSPVSERDRFERQALIVTGTGFYILTAGLVIGAVLNFVQRVEPSTTIPGVIISAISIATMWALYSYKMKIGRSLASKPIIADAHCTRTCLYLSIILLASSLLYELLKVSYIDIAGGLGIAWFAFREGRESIEKAGRA
jgi:divalent metal cation (Fe/Co/Zn/Cd) transporter